MKKKSIVLLMLLMISTGIHAQQAGQSIFGFRLGMAWGLWAGLGSGESNLSSFDNHVLIFIPALYYAFTFRDNLSLQMEFNIIEQGIEWDDGRDSGWWTYGSIDIPVLLRAGFFHGLLGFMAGPHISIPFAGGGVYADPSMTFGATAALIGLFPIGNARIVGDMRFITDFNEVVAGLRRQAFGIAMGIEWSF